MAATRGDDAVALYPVRVDVEVVPPLLVHERVEVDGEEIVHRRPVAVYAVGPHDRRVLIMRIETDVNFFRVVRDIDLGLFGRGRTVEGRLLHELGEQGCRFPHCFVQAAVDHGWRVDASGPHRGSPGNQARTFQGPIFQRRVLQSLVFPDPIFQNLTFRGRGLIRALGLSGHIPRHRNQNQPHHQGHTDPYPPGTLARPLIYSHTQHTPLSIQSKAVTRENRRNGRDPPPPTLMPERATGKYTRYPAYWFLPCGDSEVDRTEKKKPRSLHPSASRFF